jgi:hypothetical protein
MDEQVWVELVGNKLLSIGTLVLYLTANSRYSRSKVEVGLRHIM